MKHGKEIRALREPADLRELRMFVHQAGAIVDPSGARGKGTLESISQLRQAFLDAEATVEGGAREEIAIKTSYNAIMDLLD